MVRMKKKDIVRRVVGELIKRGNIDLASISAGEVQARAASEHKQSISMPLIYMVLAELRNQTGAGTQAKSESANRVVQHPVATLPDTNLLAAAMIFIQAAGSIGKARRALDKVEELVRPA
jgi:hypothetical protein